jgi:hypothetical protein
MPDDSSFRATPFSIVLPGFLHEPVKPSRNDIGLELAIPVVGVKLSEPRPECRTVLGRETTNGFLKLLDSAHGTHDTVENPFVHPAPAERQASAAAAALLTGDRYFAATAAAVC